MQFSHHNHPIPLQIGVYQGDPLSIIIFNSVMATLADTIDHHQHLGYKSPRALGPPTSYSMQMIRTCLIADSPSSCQQLLNCVERWFQWTGMMAKVPKCHSLAIQASSGKTYDPSLMLQGERMHPLHREQCHQVLRSIHPSPQKLQPD